MRACVRDREQHRSQQGEGAYLVEQSSSSHHELLSTRKTELILIVPGSLVCVCDRFGCVSETNKQTLQYAEDTTDSHGTWKHRVCLTGWSVSVKQTNSNAA